MPFRLPNDQERRALFATIKQQSSLRAWIRVCEYHQRFVEAVGAAHRHGKQYPPTDPRVGEYVPDSWMEDLLRCHEAFQNGVERLRNGDKTCFKFQRAHGHFSEGMRGLSWWLDTLGRYLFAGGMEFSPYHSPLWGQMESALRDCWQVYSEVGATIEPRFPDRTAAIESIEYLHDSTLMTAWTLFRDHAARADLTPVPEPQSPTLIPTGRTIPCYGIWEPVYLETPNVPITGLVKRWLTAETPQTLVDGCMNYLCQGSTAPAIAFPEDNGGNKGRRTLWRLLWKDERYGPNEVPSEERDYTFYAPDPTKALFGT